MTSGAPFQTLVFERRKKIAIITLNRPEALNALNSTLIGELNNALRDIDASPQIKCTILTGSAKAFAAGADIGEMKDKTFVTAYLESFLSDWDRIAQRRKPMVAAVAGFALGGGCELAMMCDFIIAAENAKFGQPEINLGMLPGVGGTQRLSRLIGHGKAMDLCLTGRFMDAIEAERAGLVARVVPTDALLPEAIAAAEAIANKSLPAILLTKESIDCSQETPLGAGMRFERKMFYASLATQDQKEGTAAFLQKRRADFKDS